VNALLVAAALTMASSLSGDWVVDLTAKADDAPHTKPMHLELLADGTVKGTFYESEIQAGR
jgi:hypothetical protein